VVLGALPVILYFQNLLDVSHPVDSSIEHGATIDKFIGDTMVIFFGDPESKGVSAAAHACVHMAIAMQTRMRDLAISLGAQRYDLPVRMRIGINTGYSNVGNLGSSQPMDHTIIGAEVNIAAWLESEADLVGILMSGKPIYWSGTWLKLKNASPFT
jgi:adenylate cyclase